MFSHFLLYNKIDKRMCLYDTPSSYFCKTTCWVSDYSVGNLRIQTLPHSGFVHVNSTCNSGRPSTISYRLLVSTIWLLQKKQISFIWTKFYVNNMRLSEHRVIKLLIGSRLEYGAETGAISNRKGTNYNWKIQIYSLFFLSLLCKPHKGEWSFRLFLMKKISVMNNV